MLFWQPKTVIELFVDNWWVNNNLFVAKYCGVENYAVLAVDQLSKSQIEEKITDSLSYFQERTG
jgi:hypothetical protein